MSTMENLVSGFRFCEVYPETSFKAPQLHLEMSTMENLVSGFRFCGVYPFNLAIEALTQL